MSVLNGLMVYQSDETPKITVKEFLKMTKAIHDKKFELIDGQIIAMANTKPRHGAILFNCSRVIGNYIFDKNGPCHFYADIICKIDEYNCPHPDIAIVCNDSVNGDLLEYPTVVGEILSTNRNDDIKKLARYRNCPSIFEILMIEQNKMEITVHKKSKLGQWAYEIYRAGETIFLDSIEFEFLVDEIYRRVNLDKK